MHQVADQAGDLNHFQIPAPDYQNSLPFQNSGGNLCVFDQECEYWDDEQGDEWRDLAKQESSPPQSRLILFLEWCILFCAYSVVLSYICCVVLWLYGYHEYLAQVFREMERIIEICFHIMSTADSKIKWFLRALGVTAAG